MATKAAAASKTKAATKTKAAATKAAAPRAKAAAKTATASKAKAPAAPVSLSTAKLVQAVVERSEEIDMAFDRKEVTAVLEMLVDVVAEEVRKGNRVSLKNFGIFRRHTKPARPKRMGRNPATGLEIEIPAKKEENVIKFRPAKVWKEAVAKAK